MARKIQIICGCVFLIAAALLIFQYFNSRTITVPETAVREPVERPTVVEPIAEPTPPPHEPTAYEPTTEPPTEPPKEPPPELLPRIVDLRESYENPDIVAFIEIPGTAVSYPIAQTGNNVFYLYHDLHWEPSRAGSVFMDYENNPYLLADDITILFGHNMRDGSKFHNVRFFHREDFFRAHTYILLDTPYRETVWDIFAFFHTTTDFDYIITNFFDHRDLYYDFLMELQRRSHFETDITLSAQDQILILSTCAAIGGNNRYVLVAKLRQ